MKVPHSRRLRRRLFVRGVSPSCSPAEGSFLRGVPPRAPRLKALFLRGVPPRAPRLKAPGPTPLFIHATSLPLSLALPGRVCFVKVLAPLLAVAGLAGLASSHAAAPDELPELGDASSAIVSPAEERRLGQIFLKQVRSGGPRGPGRGPQVLRCHAVAAARAVFGPEGRDAPSGN